MAESGGDTAAQRRRFTVELRPGETTIVSWKKLLKDNSTPNNGTLINGVAPPPSSTPPSADPPSLPSVDAVADGQGKEGAPTSRLSTVIERIERLYVGKASSDEEDLNDVVPDDDEYDTEDSFIDDAELDEYFQVDNSAIKHDGFFVNRGKLERVEPTESTNQQQKKRRRKDLAKDPGGVDGKNPNKHLKVGKKNEKADTFYVKHPSNPSHVVSLPSVHADDVKLQNRITVPEIPSKKKTSEAKSAHSGDSNGDGRRQEKEIKQQKESVGPSKNSVGETSVHRNSHGQGKSPPGRSSNNIEEPNQETQLMENSSSHERPSSCPPKGTNPVQLAKGVNAPQRKEGSSARPKRTMLEKAIRDLEKLVAESRPPVPEVQDGENQAVKRRLPPEIKQKIAKVARLAQASHGKITNEVLDRLMSIVGHMIQLRSLKRNLNIMVNMGLSAKQEKDHRVQLIKKEVADMVRSRIPLMKSKAQEQLGAMADDLQESNIEEKEALKRKYTMDDPLEDKICDLYDLYVEGLEADAGPQVRKLYAELAAFWPSGFMDNHGIKRCICRAKDRRRPLHSRQQNLEKVKRKKPLVPKPGVKAKAEVSSPGRSLLSGPSSNGGLLSETKKSSETKKPSETKLISSNAVASGTSQMPVSSSTDRPKQDKMKGTSSRPGSGDTNITELIPTKDVAMKLDSEKIETECSHDEESETLLKEGMSKRQHLTASMLNQLFET